MGCAGGGRGLDGGADCWLNSVATPVQTDPFGTPRLTKLWKAVKTELPGLTAAIFALGYAAPLSDE